MNKNLENKFIILLWWSIFVFILPWDQEKIVVLNLIIFCYLLYYMLADSIESTMSQKKNSIRAVLTQDLSKRVQVLNDAIKNAQENIATIHQIFLKLLSAYTITATSVSSTKNISAVNSSKQQLENTFSALNACLENFVYTNSVKDLNKNLLTSNVLLLSNKTSSSHSAPEYK